MVKLCRQTRADKRIVYVSTNLAIQGYLDCRYKQPRFSSKLIRPPHNHRIPHFLCQVRDQSLAKLGTRHPRDKQVRKQADKGAYTQLQRGHKDDAFVSRDDNHCDEGR